MQQQSHAKETRMPLVDLHSHSHYSDGSLAPADLVALAARAGITMLALTDHDSVAGLAEAQVAADELGIQLVPGVELSTTWNGHSIHIVGLGIDPNEPSLQLGLSQQAQARANRAKAIGERLSDLGMPGAYEGALALANSPDAISRTHYGQWLLAEGHITNLQQAFDKYLGPRKPASVPMPWASLPEVIQWIKQAGGVAVIAHPGRYPLTRTKLRVLLADFVAAGGEAMEVATATEKPEMIKYLAQLSRQFGLLASQGSDYHGKPAPWIALGRFANLPSGCEPVWTRWLGETLQ